MRGSVTLSLSARATAARPDIVIADRFVEKRNSGGAELPRVGELEDAGQPRRLASIPMGLDLQVIGNAIDSGYGRLLRERPAQFRMVRRAMVALAVVFPDELPIAVFNDRAFEGDFGVRDLVRRQISFRLGSEGFETWRNRRDADKDIASNAFAMDGLEPELRLVDRAVHVTRADQSSVEIVGPLMIGTYEALHCASGCWAYARTAMPAGIVEGAYRPVEAAHDKDRIVSNLQGEIIAGRRDLAIVAGEQPIPVEDRFKVETVEIRVGVEFLRQASAWVARLQLRQHRIFRVHVRIPRDRRCVAGSMRNRIMHTPRRLARGFFR